MEPNSANISELKPAEAPVVVETPSVVGMVAAAEIDQQIATAHRFPRSLTMFRREAMDMATLNEGVAQECLFALSRDNKVIEGPSIRLAEIIACSWRNCRVGSRIVHETNDMVVAQGIFQDLERNVVMQSEVARRITNKAGRRFSTDMIVTTTNAAQAIAKRNAIVAGVPRALWWDIYQQARRVAAGDQKSLASKRANAIAQFAVYGIKPEQIFTKLGRAGEEEITRDDLVLLFGIFTSIKDDEITPEEAFAPAAGATVAARMEEPKPTETKPPAPETKPDAAETKEPPPETVQPAKRPDGSETPAQSPAPPKKNGTKLPDME